MTDMFATLATLDFDDRWKVDFTSAWGFPEVEKLPEAMREPILKDISEVIGEAIFTDTDLSIETSGPDTGQKIIMAVGIPLGDGDSIYGRVSFDKVVDVFLNECDDDMLIPVAEQLEAAAKRIREAAKVDEARGGIEHYATGPNLVAHLVIDGAEHAAPLTKTDSGYEVTIPTVGVLKLPVKIEQRKE